MFEIAELERERLLQREARAMRRLIRLYQILAQEIIADLAGETNALEVRRLFAAKASVQARIVAWTGELRTELERLQTEAVAQAQAGAVDLMIAALGDPPPQVATLPVVTTLPADSMIDLAGSLASDSALSRLINQFGPLAANAAERTLISTIGQGLNPRQSARRLQADLGTTLNRALTLIRTEHLRVYRETSHRTYEYNANLMEGWIWLSARDRRTCAACWMLHGQVFPLYERLDDHPNGRCSPMPKMKSWSDLGYGDGIPDTRPQITPGIDVFPTLSEAQQREILGPGKLNAWKSGKLNLDDLVGRHYDPQWGSHRYERSMRQIRSG